MSRIHTSPDTTITIQSLVFPQPDMVPSLFTTQQLHPKAPHAIHARDVQADWVPALLVFCFIVLAWGQVFYHKRIQQIFRAPFSKRFINQLTRDGNLFRERISIALGLIYIMCLSLCIYEFNAQVLHLGFKDIGGIMFFGIIVLVVIGFTVAKVTMIQFLGAIFKTRDTTGNYLLNLLIFSLLTGPFLLIAMVLVVYLKSPLLLNIVLALFALVMMFRFLRGFFIGMELRKFSYLFLFVYLCSLEILPLLVLIKIVLNISHPTGA
jgi:hypothetical protein